MRRPRWATAAAGVCACSTCHVWVRKRGLDSLSEQEDDEMDRLDQGFDVRRLLPPVLSVAGGRARTSTWRSPRSRSQAFMDENPALRHQLEAEGKWPLKK